MKTEICECGDNREAHYNKKVPTGYIKKCWAWKNGKYCPCKKFVPENHNKTENERINAHVFRCYHGEDCYIVDCKCECHKTPDTICETCREINGDNCYGNKCVCRCHQTPQEHNEIVSSSGRVENTLSDKIVIVDCEDRFENPMFYEEDVQSAIQKILELPMEIMEAHQIKEAIKSLMGGRLTE